MTRSQLQDLADDLRKTEENIAAEEVLHHELQERLRTLDRDLHDLELAISEKVHYIQNLLGRRTTLRNRVMEIVDAS